MKLFDSLETLVIIALLLAGAFYFWHHDGSTVITFADSSRIEIEDGKPGDWVKLSLPIKKLRDCELQPSSPGPRVYYDGSEVADYADFERDGPLLSPAQGWQRGHIIFRISPDAPIGEASGQFVAEMRCAMRLVQHTSPPFTFEVLPPD